MARQQNQFAIKKADRQALPTIVEKSSSFPPLMFACGYLV
jgi:hypothetical protein